MELVIDANILIASFLKSATTRSLILDTRLKLYSPEHILIEGREVLRGRLAKRIKDLSDLDFDQLFTLLTERIVILPKEDYYDHLGKALEIAPHGEGVFRYGTASSFDDSGGTGTTGTSKKKGGCTLLR